MSFIYPFFLFALLFLAIPIAIHFFNFKRYKTLYFSNVHLLKLIKQESRKKSQLKQLLILISRIMALAALVFAFSRPYIPLNERVSHTAKQEVTVFIDNTFSMKSEGENGQLLEQGKMKAIEIANSYPVGTQFRILTSDFLPQHEYALNKDQFIQEISAINESSNSPDFENIYNHVVSTFQSTPQKADRTFYMLSDFQKNSFNPENLKPDSTVWSYLLPFTSGKTNNLIIDSCWFEIPGRKIGQAEKLFVRIQNLSEQAYQNIPVRLTINDSLKALANVNLSEKSESVIELNYTNNSNGVQLCKVELDDYPIIYDNSYFLSYQVHGKLNALGIYNPANNGSDYLKTLFADDEFISYSEFTENNVQISQLRNFQCIFLVNLQKISTGLKSELKSFVEQGGSLVIFPEKLSTYEEYNSLINELNGKSIAAFDTSSVSLSEINYENELYRDVFKKKEDEANMPVIHGSTRFSNEMKVQTPLLQFKNGRNALMAHRFGNGKVYTFAFPLGKLNFNFVRHVIFVPTIYNMALNSGQQQTYARLTNQDDPVFLNQNSMPDQPKLISKQSGDEFMLNVRNAGEGRKQVILGDISLSAGHYLITDGDQIIQPISFNFPRKESDQEFYTAEELQDLLKAEEFRQIKVIEAPDSNFSEILRDLNNGKQLWKYFIVMAIVFLLGEIAIIRFWK